MPHAQMETKGKVQTGSMIFDHLPRFAGFILDNHLISYISDQLQTARILDTPLLRVFGDLPDEQIIAYSVPSHTEFLTAARNNGLREYLDRSIRKWIDDQLEIVGREQIEAEDITQVSFLRKKAMLSLLPKYTSDPLEIIAIVREIDTYVLHSDTATTSTFVNLLRERINEHARFIKHNEEQLLEAQALAELGSYEWNLVTGSVEVSPQLLKVLDLNEAIELTAFMERVHHADRDRVAQALDTAMKQGGGFESEYRIYTREDKERIVWSKGHITIIDGVPQVMKGTVMDVTERHYMIQRLQRSEDLYKQAQALSHIGNWAWDLIHDKITWSEEMHLIYGLQPGIEITHGLATSFRHPEDNERVNATVAEAMASHQPYDIYYRIIVADGTIRHLHSKGEVLVSKDNVAYKMLGTLQDVTERQELVDRLQESEQLYMQAQAISHVGNWKWDPVVGTITWSDELYRIFGLEPQSEIIDFNLYLSFIHPDDREMVIAGIGNSMDSRTPMENYYRIVLKNGTERIIHSRGEIKTGHDGKATGMIGTCQDVTLQQTIQKQLKENQDFIRKIANTTPSLIASYNVKTGQYTFINQALDKILGYKPEEVMEHGVAFFLKVIHPDDLEPLMEKNSAALEAANLHPPADEEQEMVVEFKYRMKHRDGSYHWFHTYGTIFDRDRFGKVEHVLNVSVDITEQEEAEQLLFQKNMQLQQSNASLEEYAYVASHDLKEPLRKIATFSDRFISTQTDLSADGRTYLSKIIESSRRMQAMISDLLAVSVISGNRSFEHCNLKAVFNEAVQALEYKIEEKNAVIRTDELPTIRAVPSQFRQLFQNLLSNSLKFSRAGVLPEISVSHSFLSQHEVQQYDLAKAPRYLRIDFSDNGIGFDNQYTNKIFAIFQRLHGKAEYEGTGIGLAICKKVAENHGGTIFANGAINHGATFTIIIPV